MAVQYLCCTRRHTRYCYNWTIHCFLFCHQINWYMLLLFNRHYIKVLKSSGTHNHSFSSLVRTIKNQQKKKKKKAHIRILWYNKRIQLQLVGLREAAAPRAGRTRTSRAHSVDAPDWTDKHLLMAERTRRVLGTSLRRLRTPPLTDATWRRGQTEAGRGTRSLDGLEKVRGQWSPSWSI